MLGRTESVGFADIFGHQERDRLRGGDASLQDIHEEDGAWQAQIASPDATSADEASSKTTRNADQSPGFWRRAARKVAGLVWHEQSVSLNIKLLSAYTHSFQQQNSKVISQRLITPATFDNDDSQLSEELKTPLGFRMATAMDLAGICKMERGRSGTVNIRHRDKQINDKVISRLDSLVNLNPQRLAYEFIAAKKRLPNGYLQHVLVPHYLDRLTVDGRLSENEATEKITELLKEKELLSDRDIDFEKLMEIRNVVDHVVHLQRCKIRKADVAKRRPRNVPLQHTKPGSVHKVTVAQVLSCGMASRQSVRDYLIDQVRRSGCSREEARKKVVAALEKQGFEPGMLLNFVKFKRLYRSLSLHENHTSRQLVTAYLGLVSQVYSDSSVRIDNIANQLRRLGVEPSEEFKIQTPASGSSEKKLLVIEKPQLEPPSEQLTYSCNDDERWLIDQKVENSAPLRVTKDMANRMLRYVGRNKSTIAVELAARLSTAIVTAAVTGGIGGAAYLGASLAALPLSVGFSVAMGKGREWWYGRKVKKYDQKYAATHGVVSDPSKPVELTPADQRKEFHKSLGELTAEKTLTDSFNAYFNLRNELKGLEKLKGRANLSAADQIKFRKHQALQQLRSVQLGEKFKDFDRLIVETVTDLSIYEERFDRSFEQLWEPFSDKGSNGMSKERRLKIFNKAANRLLYKQKGKFVEENNLDWLKHMGRQLSDGSRISDQYIAEAFGDIQGLEAKELRRHASASRLNKVVRATKSYVMHSAKVVGHFVFSTLTWNIGSYAKAGLSWLKKGIEPTKSDLSPIPTAGLGVFWVVSFLGGRAAGLVNDYRNRVRIKKVKQGRTDDTGREVAFDSSVKELSTEDWRSLRRETVTEVRDFASVLKRLRKEHDRLDSDLHNFKPSAKDQLDSRRLVKRAEIILRRKYLEHQMGQLMSNVVGHYHQEMIRGEWLQRQLLEDKEKGLD